MRAGPPCRPAARPVPLACPAPAPLGAGCAGRRHHTGWAAAGRGCPPPFSPLSPPHPLFGSGSVVVITRPFTNFPARPAGPTLHEQRSSGATPASACSMCRPQPAHVGFPHAPQSTRRHIAPAPAPAPRPPRPPRWRRGPAPPPPARPTAPARPYRNTSGEKKNFGSSSRPRETLAR